MFALARHSAQAQRCPSIPLLTRGVRHKRPKKGVLVRLLQDIPAVGRKGAVLEVPRQIMRSWYFPEQRAEYVVRPMGGFRPGDFTEGGEEALIEQAEVALPAPVASAALRAPDLSLLLPLLQTLPPLTFSRRPISPSSPEIFGSVTTSQILQRLQEEYKIHLDPAQCEVKLGGRWVELNRLKGLGEARARIDLHGVGQAELKIKVVPADVVSAAREPEGEVDQLPEQQQPSAGA